jgi:hypothetical protein
MHNNMKAPLVIALFLIILGSCTEEIYYPYPVPYPVYRDSIVFKELLRVDTV